MTSRTPMRASEDIDTNKHSQLLNLKPLRQAIHILNLRWNLITNLSCCLIVVRLGNVILLCLKRIKQALKDKAIYEKKLSLLVQDKELAEKTRPWERSG